MKHLKKTYVLLILVTSLFSGKAFAQEYFSKLNAKLAAERAKEVRARDVEQDKEYTMTGAEVGNFFSKPLLLDGKSLDYSEFSLKSKGELTVIKGSVIARDTVRVAFYVYLRRNGNRILIPGKERPDPRQLKIDISEVFKHAKPDDQLVIEAVRKEDGPVKRILKLLGGGC